jgi:protein TonB
MKPLLFALLTLFSLSSFAQHDTLGTDRQIEITKGEKDSKQQKKTFQYVERMPQPAFNLNKYLSKSLHYPKRARTHNIEGRVIVKFIVNEDGSVSDATVVKGVDPELDEEALSAVMGMPNWIPGEQEGKKVKVYFTLPIQFKLK